MEKCNQNTIHTLLNKLDKHTVDFFIAASNYCIEKNVGNINIALIVKYRLELKMDKVIEELTKSLLNMGSFKSARVSIDSAFKMGFLTDNNRKLLLGKVDFNEDALKEASKNIIENNYYVEFGSGKKHNIITPTDWAEAIQNLQKWSSEMKDLMNDLNKPLSENDTEVLKEWCSKKPIYKCDLPCKIHKSRLFGDSCTF